MTTTTYTFESLSSYTLSNPAQFTNEGNILALQQAPDDEDYSQAFTSDTGFTYDNTKAEFTGGKVQQKDQRPANAQGAATYTTDYNLNWGSGSLTGTPHSLSAIPTVSGGELDCTGALYKAIWYANSLSTQFTIRFDYRPNYSGAPAAARAIVTLTDGSSNRNLFRIYHDVTLGRMRLTVYDDSTTLIYSGDIFANWTPTAGTKYEFELSMSSSQEIRLFIDGVQLGSTKTTAFTRGTTATRLHIGTAGSYPTDAKFDNVIWFDNVQHTSNYTAPSTAPADYIYLANTVTLPEMNHDGAGHWIDLNSFTTTETGSPRYTVQIGRSGSYLYHNGSSWVTSNGTYAQANTASAFNDNAASLDIADEIYAQFKVHFTDGATQSSVDNLTANITEDGAFPASNPYVYFNSAFRCTDISAVSKVSTITGSDNIKIAFNRNGTDYWYNSATPAWETSDGYSKTNTFAELTEEILDDLTNNNRYSIYIKVYFHSDDGSSTPTLTSYSATYDFAIGDPVLPNIVDVEGFIYDSNTDPVSGLEVLARPYEKGYWNEGIFIKYEWQTIGTTESSGYFHGPMFLQGDGYFWEFKIGKQRYKVELNDVTDMNLKDAPTFSMIPEEI